MTIATISAMPIDSAHWRAASPSVLSGSSSIPPRGECARLPCCVRFSRESCRKKKPQHELLTCGARASKSVDVPAHRVGTEDCESLRFASRAQACLGSFPRWAPQMA